MINLLFAVVLAWVACSYASDTDLESVLSAQPSLTKFTSLLKGHPDLLAVAQAGHTTIVAPNDDAFATFFATPSSAGNYSSPDALYALMQYHILNGTHASYSIPSTPIFIPTLLTNSSYTNVTTGQVVEAVTNQSAVTFRSAVHQVSNIVTSGSDIIFVGGFVHIVDAVMVPPLNALATITEYPLTYYIESLSVVLTGDFVQTVDDFTNIPNQTYFATNNKTEAQAVSQITTPYTLDNLTAYLKFFTLPGEVVYSTAFTDGSKWRNWAGVDLTIYEIDGDLYVNDAKIVIKDVLIANGVLHVLSKHLDPSDPNARPYISNTTTSPASNTPNTRNGLSTGAKAGIGIGVTVAVLALIALAIFFLRKRRSNNSVNGHQSGHILENDGSNIHEKDGRKLPYEMITKTYDAAELDPRSRAQELDGVGNGDGNGNGNGIHGKSSTTEGSSSG